ncbi:MAG: thermonuclease family protein [Chloroflexi bacterium]|nr:thermonuclease family protein [Chloroflexota bacterium]MDA1227779.1 thermonuclease family protein [Chloroflexota bacterium]
MTKVIDGDTIEVFVDGKLMTVGYIGIDAPDLKRPVSGAEPFAVEALERNREIVEGRRVLLEQDVLEVDRMGRHLRYVFVGDLMVNALLLHEGLAKSDSSSRGLKYAEIIHMIEQEAMIERLGGWRREWPNIARHQ